MTSTYFKQIGPYTIERPIGHGGMAPVFLALDTRADHHVALKVVHRGTDEDSREILASEQRGVELQRQFSAVSRHVPAVYETGFDGDYFYIAMEYIDGEDLSQAIDAGPLAWERAVDVAMQLCEFLEEADRFEAGEESRRMLLHNDLKPRNIRLRAGDEIKVLDFGAAKTLSLSRKVTRNEQGSTPYLSPECLETGDRDRHTDAWALGVLLYEMVRGRRPFRADDTRRLERRIRSRQPPEAIGNQCPPALEAIIAKLLAPYPADRYDGPGAIRADLARARAGERTEALAEGWPDRLHDQAATRRTHPPIDDEPVTRVVAAQGWGSNQGQTPKTPGSDPGLTPWRFRVPPLVRHAVIVVALFAALNEGCVAVKANGLADTVPVQDFSGLAGVWPQYESLAGWSFLGGMGVNRLERAITSQTMVLADRVMANYRTPLPTVRENQWKAARDALMRALPLAPRDTSLRAALRYCDGQLHRINGEASRTRGQQAVAQQEFTEAVVAFREAAALRGGWPDPFLGLARTFIYGLEDVDRAADAFAQAEKLGHHSSERETTQLADGYRARGETLWRTAQTLRGMPQERDYLTRAADAYREALTRYSSTPGFGNAAQGIRETQGRLDRVELRLADIGESRRRAALGVTYARGRDVRQRRIRIAAATRGEWLLALTSAVMVLAIGLAYAGRTSADAWRKDARSTPINLMTFDRADALEAPLSTVFDLPADRRFAARMLAAYLRPDQQPRPIANVGALARIDVAAAQIDRDRNVVVFRERLEALRREAAEARRDPPDSMPLFTAADLTALKPALAVRTSRDFTSTVMWCVAALIVPFHIVSIVWRWRGVGGDRILLALAQLLVGIGAAVILSRTDPLRDTLLLARYTEGVVIGVVLFGAVSLIDIERAAFRELSYVPLIAALLLSVTLIVFGSGPGTSNAKVNLGPVQPIEAIRLLLGLFLAGYFARRWELLRQVGRLDHVLPVAAGVGAALLLFFFQRDLGPALLLTLTFLAMFAVARGGVWLAGAGLAALIGGVAIGEWLKVSQTLAARVEMWRSPWDNLVRGGDQVAQALWGLAAGAVSGTGLGLGHTRFVPEAHTDLVLAAIGEELGLAGLVMAGTAFALIAWRGLTIARRAPSDYAFFLAVAMTLALTIPVAVMAAGILGVLPLTGVVTPFLSYGGSAMAANFVALGLLAAVGSGRRPAADLAPFTIPTRWLGRIAMAGAAALAIVAASVQTLRADEYLVRPQLGVQADGGRRFQYNPRVLEAVAAIPRGGIFDRNGRPLAQPCAGSTARCYPGGAPFFHVLGDANTRANWSAANSSYVERDAEALLRGFDDRATTIATTDRDGRTSAAIRRDYSAIVPLVRHRYEPDHPDVKAILTRPRDVRITIDAQLQDAAASVLARAARTSGAGRGAVVVLDADTGQILASVSYPWVGTGVGTGVGSDPLLDRARYGLYPPGSTFKMITAAAALRENPGFDQKAFVCQRLPSNRIGIRIPGFGPPIHDDVEDTHPHGRIAMHDAVVQSCNAYFAQLAVAIGPEALSRTAATAGITLNSSRSTARIRANLPHAGYGQGEVLLTPLRLARVTAALGTDGTIRETPIFLRASASSASARGVIETPFVSPEAAKMLAGYLRDAVTNGTGRLLKDHPVRIAGKTGTAEVDEAAPHAWFTGVAPYGPATRRIAFAVVLEHAGYGGAAAANVAGQIVTSAAAMGLAK